MQRIWNAFVRSGLRGWRPVCDRGGGQIRDELDSVYIQAILQIARAEARDLLGRLLSEPEYELDAVWGLFQMVRIENPSPVVWPRNWPMRSKGFSLIWKARDGQPEVEFVEPLRTEAATFVKNHIGALARERAASEHPGDYFFLSSH